MQEDISDLMIWNRPVYCSLEPASADHRGNRHTELRVCTSQPASSGDSSIFCSPFDGLASSHNSARRSWLLLTARSSLWLLRVTERACKLAAFRDHRSLMSSAISRSAR